MRSPEEVAKQVQLVSRDDLQVTLAAMDPFSDEMQVMIFNTGAIQNSSLLMPVSSFAQGPQAAIKVYNCQS